MNKKGISYHYYNLFLFLIFCSSCAPLIGPYSPTAYQNATSLKAETLALMDRATQPYSENEQRVQDLKVKIDAAYEYVNGIPSNSISAEQWKLLKKPDGKLLGKFLLRWKEEGVLSQAYINEFKGLISDAYDEIICLEANKKGSTDCKKSTGGQ